MIYLIGSKGNMGTRYKSILNYLNIEYKEADISTNIYDIVFESKKSEGIIIATPTDTHYFILENLFESKINTPILCEKPLSRNIDQVETIVNTFSPKMPITMVFQYWFTKTSMYRLPTSPSLNYLSVMKYNELNYSSYYNYFKHGKDGLNWDCIQPLAMAEEDFLGLGESPIWDCVINGYKVDINSMDQAYIDMVKFWISNPGVNIKNLISIHKKVVSVNGNEKCINWHSSEKH